MSYQFLVLESDWLEDRAMMEGATPLLAAALQGHTKAWVEHGGSALFFPFWEG